MKKICFILFIFCLTGNVVFALNPNDCVDLYNNGQYQKSTTCFYTLLLKDKNNAKLKLYYGNSLVAEKKYLQAKIQYNEVIQQFPYSTSASSAKKNLVYVNKMLHTIQTSRSTDSGNYISELGGYVKWSGMPINVWIQPSVYSTSAKNAFVEWQNKTKGAVTFVFVSDMKKAQIFVAFTENVPTVKGGHALGITKVSYNGKYITRAIMNIKSVTKTGAKQTPSQIYPVVLHEAGHALGMKGHSKSPYDVMYYSDGNYRNALSNRDVNTVKSMYD